MHGEDSGFLMLGSLDAPAAQLTVNDESHRGLPPGFTIGVSSPSDVKEIYAAILDQGLPIVEPLPTRP